MFQNGVAPNEAAFRILDGIYFKTWRSTNALVTAWIFNSIETELRRSIAYRPEARLVWTNIQQQFCQGNDARVYRLQAEIIACRLSHTESFMAYYGRITSLWDDLMEHDPIPSCSCKTCPCDWVSIFESRREKKRVRDFLIGLDDRFDNARSQILGTDPIPNLNLVYNRLLQEEGVRSFSLNKPDSQPDPMAFAARVNHGSKPVGGGGNRDSKPDRHNNPNRPFCIACQKHGHYLRTCYLVTGNFPDWWGDRPRDRIQIDPNATDMSQAVYIPDPRGGRTQQNRHKGSAHGFVPRIHIASSIVPSTGHGNGSHGNGANGVASSNSSLNALGKIDFNSLNPQELEEITQMWKARKFEPTDRLNGVKILSIS
ncbi:uncharacterized protein LOC141655712 [Silene latifolia]|uniref:uncharacterized protein LOC141655712 n=1 Tax=Silene latifolia TaxID=37657 RepID=UPI003D7766DB